MSNPSSPLSPEKYYGLGKSPSPKKRSSYIRNTVLIANQLLDSIEKDIKVSKNAVISKEKYIDMIENENATLRAQLIDSKSQIKELQNQLQIKEQEMIEFQTKSRNELHELTQVCESEMSRVMQQIQQRESILQQNEDILSQTDYRVKELQKALQLSEHSKELMNSELNTLVEERKQWIEKIEQSDRFCSTLATAHQELSLRCEYLQQRLHTLSGDQHFKNSSAHKQFESSQSHFSQTNQMNSRNTIPFPSRHRPPPPPPPPPNRPPS